jgi:hypothetical protein
MAMSKNTWRLQLVASKLAAIGVVAAGCVTLGGCTAGATTSVADAASSDLLVGDGEPLDSVDESAWGPAIPSCEGQLDGGEQFALAAGANGLVAAVQDGQVVCVDTVEAVEEELDDTGREEEADRLIAAYQATIEMFGNEAVRLARPNHEGDPDPEPNLDSLRYQMRGDPDPEPNVGQ